MLTRRSCRSLLTLSYGARAFATTCPRAVASRLAPWRGRVFPPVRTALIPLWMLRSLFSVIEERELDIGKELLICRSRSPLVTPLLRRGGQRPWTRASVPEGLLRSASPVSLAVNQISASTLLIEEDPDLLGRVPEFVYVAAECVEAPVIAAPALVVRAARGRRLDRASRFRGVVRRAAWGAGRRRSETRAPSPRLA